MFLEERFRSFTREEVSKLKINSLLRKAFPHAPNALSKIKTWSEQRKKEYLLARCMLQEIVIQEKILLDENTFLSNKDRTCIWPKGYTGTISHTLKRSSGELSVIVALSDKNIGYDLEYLERFNDSKLERVICTEDEQELLKSFSHKELHLGFIFCAKEALFKKLYPICNTFFGFHDAKVINISKNSSLQIELVKTLPNIDKKIFKANLELIEKKIVLAKILV